MRTWLKALTSMHIPSGEPDVFIFASPRSGSTLVHEVLVNPAEAVAHGTVAAAGRAAR